MCIPDSIVEPRKQSRGEEMIAHHSFVGTLYPEFSKTPTSHSSLTGPFLLVIIVLKNPTHCPSFRPFDGSWGSPGFLMTSLQAGGWWAHLYRGLRAMRLGPNPQVPDIGETTLSNAAKSPIRFTWSFFKLLLVNLLYLLLNSCICWVILEVATEYVFSFIPSIFCESGKAVEPINCLYSL